MTEALAVLRYMLAHLIHLTNSCVSWTSKRCHFTWSKRIGVCSTKLGCHLNWFVDTSALIYTITPVVIKLQYIPRNMHTVFALLCFIVVIHWPIFPYPSGLLHWHCGNLTIAPVPAKQPWWIWINTSCEFIMNDCITTTKQSTTKPCAYFLGYTVHVQHCFAFTWTHSDNYG